MSAKSTHKKRLKAKQNKKLTTKENQRIFLKQFIPLIIAVVLWVVTLLILHLPGIKDDVMLFFVKFTLDSAVIFGQMLFIPVESHGFPNITVDGYTMRVVMECTAYNFYIFVFYLSLLSPVSWRNRLITLVIFILSVFIVNNLRFYTMGYIGNFSASMFHIIHDYLWNILFGFMVFLIWAWRYNTSAEVTSKIKNQEKP